MPSSTRRRKIPVIAALRAVSADVVAEPARRAYRAVVADDAGTSHSLDRRRRSPMNEPRMPEQHISLLAEEFKQPQVFLHHLEKIRRVHVHARMHGPIVVVGLPE